MSTRTVRAFSRLAALLLAAVLLAACGPRGNVPQAANRPTALPRPSVLPQGTAAAAATVIAGTAAPAATAAAGAVATAAAYTPVVTAVPAADAASALTTYASEVLGRAVTVKNAGGLTAPIQRVLGQQAGSYAGTAVDLAAATYAGALTDGAASVSYGSGTLSGDFTVDVNSASLGVYAIQIAGAGPADAAAALALVQSTYPALAGLAWQDESTAESYVFYAYGSTPWVDPRSGTAGATAQAVVAGVTSGARVTTVWIAVGRGDFAALVR